MEPLMSRPMLGGQGAPSSLWNTDLTPTQGLCELMAPTGMCEREKNWQDVSFVSLEGCLPQPAWLLPLGLYRGPGGLLGVTLAEPRSSLLAVRFCDAVSWRHHCLEWCLRLTVLGRVIHTRILYSLAQCLKVSWEMAIS